MEQSLKAKTLVGLFWSFCERIGQQCIQFVITIILARLILPEEFGLIAMIMVFTSIAAAIVDSGYGAALIQKQDSTYVDQCSVYYFNLLVSIVLASILFITSPFIAAFYESPALETLTQVMSINLVIGGLGLVQSTLLTKELNFKTQLQIGLTATILSGTIGIVLAYRGYGVWALAAQLISRNVIRLVLLWMFHSWRPGLIFSYASLKSMFPYGSRLLAAKLITTVFDNLLLIVIGKAFSMGELGYYTRAKGLQQIPVSNVAYSVGRVTFPVFSSVQEDVARLKRGVRKALKSLAMLNFPIMIGIAVVADPLVRILFTEKWLPSVPFLQLLCLVGLLHPLHGVNVNVLKATGRSDLNLRINILKNGLKLVFLIITYRWGIEAILWGQVILSVLCYFVNTYYTASLIDYPIQQQFRDMLPIFSVTVLMGCCAYFLQYLSYPNYFVQLISQSFGGVLVYWFLSHVFKLSIYEEMRKIVLSKLS